jgi:hypothetical protein
MRRTCSHRPPAFQPSAFSIAVRESESSADLYLARLRQVWGAIGGHPADVARWRREVAVPPRTQGGRAVRAVTGVALASLRCRMVVSLCDREAPHAGCDTVMAISRARLASCTEGSNSSRRSGSPSAIACSAVISPRRNFNHATLQSSGTIRSGARSICPPVTSASAAPVSISATNHLQATLASTTSVTWCRDLVGSVRYNRTAQRWSGSDCECGAPAQHARRG